MASKREALIASAQKSLQKGKPDSALKDYLKVLEETPNDINILNTVGDLFVRLNRNEESIPYFLKIAEHYGRDGFFLKAIAIYKKINKLDPARLDVYERLAELYGKQGLVMEAKSQYQVLADYYSKQDNLTGAIAIYQKMMAAEPQNIQLHVKLADLYTQAKRVPDALKEYAIVASMLRERGALDESIQVFDKALKIAPDNVEILKTFVPMLLEASRFEQARDFLRRALEITPRSVPLFVLAAEAALAMNDLSEARAFAQKAQSVEPESEEVLTAVVRIQLKGRRPDMAFQAAAPLADQLVRKGESKKALAVLQPIAKSAPDNEDVLRKIIDITMATGDEKGTLPYRSALVEVWRKAGKLTEAADQLRACMKLAPEVSEYRARLSQIEPQLPKPPAAPPPAPEDLSFPGIKPTRPAPPPPPPPPPPQVQEVQGGADEFEFELPDEELEEVAPAPQPPTQPAMRPLPPAPAPPPGPRPPAPTAVPGYGLGRPPEFRPASIEVPMDLARSKPAPPPPEVPAPAAWGVSGGAPSYGAPQAPPPSASIEEAEEVVEEVVEVVEGGEGVEELTAAEEVVEVPAAAGPVHGLPGGVSLPGVSYPGIPAAFTSPAPAPVAPRPVVDTEVEEALVEADVFRKYGLLEKAADHLRNLTKKKPDSLRAREKLFEVLLEQGKKALARREAEALKDGYRAEGREDRVKALEALLGEPFAAAAAPSHEVEGIALRPQFAAEMLERREAPAPPPPAPPAPRVPEPPPPAPIAAPVAPAPPAPPVRPPAAPPASLGGLDFGAGPPVPPAPVPAPPPVVATILESPVAARPVPPPPPPPKPRSFTQELMTPLAPSREPVAPKPARPIEISLPPAAPAAPAKPKTVRPTDIQIDIPGAPPAARPKPPRPAEIELPKDLLQRPASRPAAAPAEHPRHDPSFLERPKGRVPRPEAEATPLSLEMPAGFLDSGEVRRPPSLEPAATAMPGGLGDIAFGTTEPAPAPEAEAAAMVRPGGPGDGASGAAAAMPAAPSPVPELVSEELVPAQPEEPAAEPVAAGPSADELGKLDFCLEQGMVVDAAEQLQTLEHRFPGHPELQSRRQRLEGGAQPAAPGALADLFSDDLDSVLDAQLGKALTAEMAREAPAAPPRPAAKAPDLAPVDESGLFSDEAEFFNFADELQSEMKQELPAQPQQGGEVSLEEIFREFKKGVEQQLSPEDYETHYNLGIAYKEMQLIDEAIGEFQLAAKSPVLAVECCSMLGLCFLEKGLPQLAVKWYRKGLETPGIREDDRLGLLYDLGSVFLSVGERENAYKTFLELYGSNAAYRDVGERLKELAPA